MQYSWAEAYRRFLMNRNESLFLKIAPLLLLFGAPEILVSNIVPVVGELVDIGGVWLAIIVMLRTIAAVKKYRF